VKIHLIAEGGGAIDDGITGEYGVSSASQQERRSCVAVKANRFTAGSSKLHVALRQ
jgi:hypothetical protein